MKLNECMNRFRLASRELFNHYFHASAQGAESWEIVERFEALEQHLFEALVVAPARLPDAVYGTLQRGILVLLRAGEHAPLMLNREVDSGYWDHSQQNFTCEVVFQFKKYFDWESRDFKDHRYAHVVVAEWPGRTELVGKHALVETQYVRFSAADSVVPPAA